MKPGNLDLPTIWRGRDWPAVVIRWRDQNGEPFNLTGWFPFAQTRSGISLNPEVTNAALGETRMSLTRNQSLSMKLGVEQWDWVWYSAAADFLYPPVLAGQVVVEESTTRNFTNVT